MHANSSRTGQAPLIANDAEATANSLRAVDELAPQSRPEAVRRRAPAWVLDRDLADIRQPRSRACEYLLSAAFGLFTLSFTVWITLGIAVPLVWHEFTWFFNVLLAILSIVALASSSFVLQVGWGALQWTKTYQQTKDVNWYEQWNIARRNRGSDVKDWSCVRHFVILTAYKEPLDMLRLAAFALMSQRSDGGKDFCRQHVVLVLAMEEREGTDARLKAERLIFELESQFCGMIATYHPAGLPGDIPGKASNYKWAVGEVEEYIRSRAGQEAGLVEADCIVHVADADSLFDPNYFPNVQYHYCVNPDRDECVWQPCMIPTCNFWDLTPPARQLNLLVAAQEMMAAYDPWEFQITFSTYGIALSTLQAIGAGNAGDAQDGDVITEDHHLFIKGFYALGGALRVHPIFLPCLNFSVGGEPESCWTSCKNFCDRFVQAKRHMFGVAELVYVLALFSRNGCGWFCRRRTSRCARVRGFALIWKFGKVHMLPYAGMWVLLGVALITILKADKIICELKGHDSGHQNPWSCDFAVTRLTETLGVTVFTVSSFLSVFGGLFSVVSFSRMLLHTHHTLMHIADPTGPLMPSLVWEVPSAARTPPRLASRTLSVDTAKLAARRTMSLDTASSALAVANSSAAASADTNSAFLESGLSQQLPEGKALRVTPAPAGSEAVFVQRPVMVGSGFPWCGVVMQLCLEFIVFSFVVTVIYGTIPAVLSLLQLIRGGHRMEYVVAAKPGSAGDQATAHRISEESEGEGNAKKYLG